MSVLVIRPSKAAYWAGVITSLPLSGATVVGTVWVNLRLGNASGVILGVVMMVTAASCLGAMWLYFRNTRLVIDHGSIAKTDGLGRKHVYAAADRAVRMVLVESFAVSPVLVNQQLFVFDPRGRRLLRMRGEYWTPEQMAEVTTALGGTPKIVRKQMTPATMRKAYPHSVLWAEASPIRAALLIVLIMAVILVTLGVSGALGPVHHSAG